MEFIERYGAFIFTVFSGVCSAVLGWFLWSLRSSFASKDEHKQLSLKHDALDLRLLELRKRQEELPTRDDIHALRIALMANSADLKATNERLAGSAEMSKRMQNQLDRVEDYLRGK